MIEREIEMTREVLDKARRDSIVHVGDPTKFHDDFHQIPGAHAVVGFNTEGERRQMTQRQQRQRRKARKAARTSRKRNR